MPPLYLHPNPTLHRSGFERFGRDGRDRPENQGQDSVLGRWEGVTEGVTPVTEGVTGPLDLSHDLPRDLSHDLSPAKK